MTVPEDPRLTITIDRSSEPPAVVRVTGDLDPHTAPLLDLEVRELIESDNPKELILDLEGVDFIDSAGLRVLLGLLKSLRESGSVLVLQNLSGAAQRLFELTKLTGEFEIR